MLSIRDYAKNKGCSYEAVRKQVNRYKAELEGHISKANRTQYLDEYAVEFLDSKRAANPVVVLEIGKDEEIKRLEEENRNLLLKVAELQDALLREKDLVKQLQGEKIQLLEKKEEQPEEKKTWWKFWL